MKSRRKIWEREELIIAFNLYCRIPFGRIHNSNQNIIKIAEILGRSPSSVSMKMCNFARFDPQLKKRNIKIEPQYGEGMKVWTREGKCTETIA